jgi:hypothetical protein
MSAVGRRSRGPVIARYRSVTAVDLFTARTAFWLMEPIRLDLGLRVRPPLGPEVNDMSRGTVRDLIVDHQITPQKAAVVVIDYRGAGSVGPHQRRGRAESGSLEAPSSFGPKRDVPV